MDDKTKKSDDKASGAAKEKAVEDAPDNGGGDDPQKRIAELEKENKALKAQVAPDLRLRNDDCGLEEKKTQEPPGVEKGNQPAGMRQDAALHSPQSEIRNRQSVRPRDVDDRKTSLEDKLRDGFMAAYESRVGAAANE
jgi:adenine-specific DNA-methyltransferase